MSCLEYTDKSLNKVPVIDNEVESPVSPSEFKETSESFGAANSLKDLSYNWLLICQISRLWQDFTDKNVSLGSWVYRKG